jgi:hypothetical protein
MSNPTAENAALCPWCHVPHAAGQRFCGACGGLVDTEQVAALRYLQDHLPRQIATIVEERFKDQKLVELETSALVAERSIKWAKAVASFLGIPILAFAALLSFLGVKTYSDLTELQKKTATVAAEVQIQQDRLSDVKEDFDAVIKDGETLKNTIEKRGGSVVKEITEVAAELAGARAQLVEISQRQEALEDDLWGVKRFIGEGVVVPPTAARLDPVSDAWIVPLHAWVLEREQDSVWRGNVIDVFADSLDLPEGSETNAVFRERVGDFLVDNESGKIVELSLEGRDYLQLPKTAANGHTQVEANLPAADLPPGDGDPWLSAKVILDHGDPLSWCNPIGRPRGTLGHLRYRRYHQDQPRHRQTAPLGIQLPQALRGGPRHGEGLSKLGGRRRRFPLRVLLALAALSGARGFHVGRRLSPRLMSPPLFPRLGRELLRPVHLLGGEQATRH